MSGEEIIVSMLLTVMPTVVTVVYFEAIDALLLPKFHACLALFFGIFFKCMVKEGQQTLVRNLYGVHRVSLKGVVLRD